MWAYRKVTQFNYNQAIFKDLLSLIQYVKREQAEEIKRLDS